MPKRKLDKPTLPKALMQPIEIIPIALPSIIIEGSIEAAEEKLHELHRQQREFVNMERAKKLILLMEYYQVSTNQKGSWQSLAVALACDFIDGFKVAEKKLKSRKWDAAVLYMLWFEVRLFGPKHSAYNACRLLAKKAHWHGLLQRKERDSSPDQQVKALYEWYLKSQKSPLVRFAENTQSGINSKDSDMAVFQQLYDTLSEVRPMKRVTN